LRKDTCPRDETRITVIHGCPLLKSFKYTVNRTQLEYSCASAIGLLGTYIEVLHDWGPISSQYSYI